MVAALRQRPCLKHLHISATSNRELAMCSPLATQGVELSLHEEISSVYEAQKQPCWVLNWSDAQLDRIVKLHLHSTATPSKVSVLPRLSACKSLAIDHYTRPLALDVPDWVLPPALEHLSIDPRSLEWVTMPWRAGLQSLTVGHPSWYAVADLDHPALDHPALLQLPPGCALEVLDYTVVETDPEDVQYHLACLSKVKSMLAKASLRFWDMSQELAAALAESVTGNTALEIRCARVCVSVCLCHGITLVSGNDLCYGHLNKTPQEGPFGSQPGW
jgi:hypothetical protein